MDTDKRNKVIFGVVAVGLLTVYFLFNFLGGNFGAGDDNNTPSPSPSVSQPSDEIVTQTPTAKPTDGQNSNGSPVDGAEGDNGETGNMKFPISQKEMNNAGTVGITFTQLWNTYNFADPAKSTDRMKSMLADDTMVRLQDAVPFGRSAEQATANRMTTNPTKIDVANVPYVSNNEIGLVVDVTVDTSEKEKVTSSQMSYSLTLSKKSSGTWGVKTIENTKDPVIGSD